MKCTSMVLLSVTVCLLAVQGSFAIDRVDVRQATQQVRIGDGVRDGTLTKREAVRLRDEQRIIKRAERKANRDGVVSPREKARLEKMQNRSGRDIRRQKHDAQVRVNRSR